MKPRQGEEEAEALPQSEASPSDPNRPTHTYEWLVPGGQTARTLEEAAQKASGAARSVPETQLLSEAIVQSLGREAQSLVREATAMLPDAAPAPAPAASAPPVARTVMFPENGKLVSGLIEPRPPSPGSTRIAPASGATMRPPMIPVPVGGSTRIAPLGSPIGVPTDKASPPPHASTPPLATSAPTPIPNQTPTPFGASSAPFKAPGVGARLGQYEIIRELGAGGMGVVYLARDDRLGRRVAIKFLQTGNAELTRRFIVEARATARCSHENIVVIYEVGELQGSPFMVLEYLQGQTLSAVIKKSAPMPPTRAVELIAAVIRALACAHEQGIVHRDLKPENILLTDSGTVKVLDFGIAKVLQDEPRDVDAHRDQARPEAIGPAALDMAARTGIIGTMAYMSPEQWGVGGVIDHRTDIWATGLILFQMLTGRHPLETLGGDPRAWVTDLDSPLPSLRNESTDVPPELADVVDKCLKKRRDERFPDAAALLRALEPFTPGRFARGSKQVESGPYAGLRAFQEEDAGRFFGRSREIAALATRIRDTPLMATVGPSGIGKSSLIRAGVVPALKTSGEQWEALVLRPGRDPMAALAGLLAPRVSSSPTPVEDIGAQKELAKRFETEPGYLGSALRSIARRGNKRVLLFIDQFEELYTLGTEPAERRAFTAALSGAADDATSPVRVVASIRADFLGRIAEDPHFMNELSKGLFFLGPPTADGLREAITQPADMAGYRFEAPGMIDDMIQYLESTPAALPLLQFAAAQLWEARDPRRKLLTKQSYGALGGIAGALVSHADRVIGKLPHDLQALARPLFVQLVTAERTRAVREIEELRETSSDKNGLQRLIDQLVESRLLVVQTGGGGGGATVEIVHESLITNWPTLRRWLDESQEDSLFLEQLRQAARQWHAKNRDIGLLWGGDMVDELSRFQRRFRGELPDVVRAFSDEVFRRRAKSARRRRRLLAMAGVMSVLLLAAAGVALFVIHNSQMAAEQNAAAATQAQGEAQRRLQEVETKERERQRAEAAQKEAQKEVVTANTKVEMTNEELAQKNVELGAALEKAKEQKQRAESAQVAAERDERNAREAEERARLAQQQTEQLLKRERERADRLNAQLGQLVERLR
jgi:serine/threonine protein kinase